MFCTLKECVCVWEQEGQKLIERRRPSDKRKKTLVDRITISKHQVNGCNWMWYMPAEPKWNANQKHGSHPTGGKDRPVQVCWKCHLALRPSCFNTVAIFHFMCSLNVECLWFFGTAPFPCKCAPPSTHRRTLVTTFASTAPDSATGEESFGGFMFRKRATQGQEFLRANGTQTALARTARTAFGCAIIRGALPPARCQRWGVRDGRCPFMHPVAIHASCIPHPL